MWSRRHAAVPFVPHSFRSEIQMLDGASLPKVTISHVAYSKMYHYVDIATQEVSWLGTVDADDTGYRIDDVFLFDQEVTASSTEISAEGLSKLTNDLIRRPGGISVVNRMRFWGHSHVHMSVGPSYQDEVQMQLFDQNDCDFFIRGIANKRGEIRLDLFLFAARVKIVDIPWIVEMTIDQGVRDQIERDYGDMVKERRWEWLGPRQDQPSSPAGDPPARRHDLPGVAYGQNWDIWNQDEEGQEGKAKAAGETSKAEDGTSPADEPPKTNKRLGEDTN